MGKSAILQFLVKYVAFCYYMSRIFSFFFFKGISTIFFNILLSYITSWTKFSLSPSPFSYLSSTQINEQDIIRLATNPHIMVERGIPAEG